MIQESPHRRFNPLTGEWVLVSPHRTKRPWQGQVEPPVRLNLPAYEPDCYLCPGNHRADGSINPNYQSVYSFTNDYAALLPGDPDLQTDTDGLLVAQAVTGSCRVICFSPRHDLTLPLMETSEIGQLIHLWKEEFALLSSDPTIKYVQIFENKGSVMGCSNPHPHGQVWSSSQVPVELVKETNSQATYWESNGTSLLADYLALELKKDERIVCQNDHFVALVPFWAVWPFETMIISRRKLAYLYEMDSEEDAALADILKRLTTRYDNLFSTSFPYSAGIHQAPVNNGLHPGWHWHMHFFPPLLRSATIKKFMVGYEMLANPQRDITPEWAAGQLRAASEIHYSTISNLENRN